MPNNARGGTAPRDENRYSSTGHNYGFSSGGNARSAYPSPNSRDRKKLEGISRKATRGNSWDTVKYY